MAENTSPVTEMPSQQNQRRQQRRNATSLPRPETTIPLELKSSEAQRLFRRTYERTDAALIWLDTVLDQVASDEQLSQADDIIKANIKECSEEIAQRIEQMKKLREEHGIDTMEISYKNTQKIKVVAQTPTSIRFAGLFTSMDKLMTEVDILWFAELLDRNQRKDATSMSRKMISDVSKAIIAFNSRAQSLIQKNKSQANSEPEQKQVANA